MKTLFIETTMGASGDMLLGALIGLMPEPEKFVERLNQLGFENLEVKCKTKTSMGIAGNRIKVRFDGQEECGHKDHHEHEKKHKKHHEHHEGCCGKHHKGDAHEHHEGCCGRHHKKDHHSEHFGSAPLIIAAKDSRSHHHKDGKHHKEHKEHSHNDLASLGKIIDTLDVDEIIKSQAKEVYQIIAEAEAKAHNMEVSQIHFHELGEKDAVFDIVAVCLAIDELEVDKIIATPIHVGYGKVKTAHGKLPIPTPATAEILRGIPIYSKDVKGELCTPTGASLLKYFVNEFRQMPMAVWDKIGYGVGKKEFEEPNILRCFIGESMILD
ncbi:MAG: LarC family nickel insertion protein [Peptostreptococcaceae bacterium]|nr:LarC family nickel insertion protein [Peptostreptococcaceae bacterium]